MDPTLSCYHPRGEVNHFKNETLLHVTTPYPTFLPPTSYTPRHSSMTTPPLVPTLPPGHHRKQPHCFEFDEDPMSIYITAPPTHPWKYPYPQ
eukprot:747167-Hanusia_phi.AAC.1